MKFAMKSVLTEVEPDEEDFRKSITVIESLVNNRSIGTSSTNSDGPTCLTPNCFLMGDESSEPAAPVFLPCDRKWFQINGNLDRIWERLTKEIVPYFFVTHKWFKVGGRLGVEDIVLSLKS